MLTMQMPQNIITIQRPQHNQFGQQGPHGQNMQFSHQQGQGYQQPQFKQQSFNYNQSTTTSTTLDGSSSSSSSSTTTSSSTQTTSSTSGNLYTYRPMYLVCI